MLSVSEQRKLLMQAIDQAIVNGWNLSGLLPDKVRGHLDCLRYTIRDGKVVVHYREKYWADVNAISFTGKPIKHLKQFRLFNERAIDINTLLFDHYFARALWGTEEVSAAGLGMTAIAMKFRQMAVEVAGKVFAVEGNKPFDYIMSNMQSGQNLTMQATITEPELKRVTIQLENLMRVVPFKTHELESFDLYGTEPAYEYHLKQMAVAEDPLEYLAKTI